MRDKIQAHFNKCIQDKTLTFFYLWKYLQNVLSFQVHICLFDYGIPLITSESHRQYWKVEKTVCIINRTSDIHSTKTFLKCIQIQKILYYFMKLISSKCIIFDRYDYTWKDYKQFS